MHLDPVGVILEWLHRVARTDEGTATALAELLKPFLKNPSIRDKRAIVLPLRLDSR